MTCDHRALLLGVLGFAETSKPPTLEAIRSRMIDQMSGWSETNYAAGWLYNLDTILFQSGNPLWKALAEVAEGWPLGYRAEGGWVDLETAQRFYDKKHLRECPARDDTASECRCEDNSPEWD